MPMGLFWEWMAVYEIEAEELERARLEADVESRLRRQP